MRGKWDAPAGLATDQVIDHLIEGGWRQRNAQPSVPADDRTFIRRIYVDLIGRIPTTSEVEAYLSRGPSRRAELVDQLLGDDEYARYFAEVFDVVLMGRQASGERPRRRQNRVDAGALREKWTAYLEEVFSANRPWNEVVSEMILARPTTPKAQGAVYFLFARQDNHQAMAEAVGRLAFGVQIDCAQCHNHPLAAEIEQRHYWGLVAAFNRGKNQETEAGPAIAESAIGGFVNFTNLKKESQPALLALLTNKTLEEDRPAADVKEEDAPEKYVVAPGKGRVKLASVPKFSRRAKLADELTRENPLLARAMVNRIWAMLMGRGLVHPVDQMDSKHPASHRELLDWLTADFEKSNYDVRRLVRMIVLSKAYQLESRPASAAMHQPESFASALEKPLSAEALWRSLLVASGHWGGEEGTKGAFDPQPLRRALTAGFPDLFVAEYHASLQQAMFLTNSPLVEDLFKPREGNTTTQVLAIDDPAKRVTKAFEMVLGREPSKEEMEQSVQYLKERSDRPEAAVRQMLWAMVTSAEFLLNH